MPRGVGIRSQRWPSMIAWTFERRTTAPRFAWRPARPRRRSRPWSIMGSPGPYLRLSALIAIAAVAAGVLAWLLPAPLFLPALSIVSLAAAAGVALYAHCSGVDRHGNGITAWDVAGAFAVLWVAAGTFSDPQDVLQLFGHPKMAP
jgi:hypothetical protein